MRPYSAICLLFLLNGIFLTAQGKRNSTEKPHSYLTFSPFSLADPFAPRLRTGYIQHLHEHWKVGLEVGLGVDEISFFGNNTGEEYLLWEIRPELYYVLKPEARTLKYISAELFYIDQSNVLTDGDYETEDTTNFRYDRADFDRQKYGMHLKFGLFLNIGKRMGFNFYGGIGFRWRNNEFTNVVNPVEDRILREWYATLYDTEGKNFAPNPTLGIKFYYRL